MNRQQFTDELAKNGFSHPRKEFGKWFTTHRETSQGFGYSIPLRNGQMDYESAMPSLQQQVRDFIKAEHEVVAEQRTRGYIR